MVQTAFAEEGSPSRFIMMWSGLISDIPSGWALADGNNGTPDLTDRFLIGVKDKQSSTGTTSGSHTVSLSSKHLPDHTHTGGTDTGGSHNHDMEYDNDVFLVDNDGFVQVIAGTGSDHVTTNSAGSHSHSVDNVGSTGSGGAIDSRPLYYEVAFIVPI